MSYRKPHLPVMLFWLALASLVPATCPAVAQNAVGPSSLFPQPIEEAASQPHSAITLALLDELNLPSHQPSSYGERTAQLGWIAHLLDQGADINAHNKYHGQTPLMLAIERHDLSLIDLLLARGARIDATDAERQPPLFYAVEDKVELVQKLLDLGANVDAVSAYGNTALIKAASRGNNPENDQGNKILKLLLDHHAGVLQKNYAGRTALMEAASVGDATTIRRLLQRGAEVNVADKEGETALMEATYRGDRQSMMLLLSHGADVRAKDKAGNTVLMLSAGRTIMTELICRGVAINAVNNKGQSALMLRAGNGYNKSVQVLLKQGADVRIRDTDGYNALIYAVFNGNMDVIKSLLKAGIDVNIKTHDGQTALIIAKSFKLSNMVRLLKRYGAKQ